MQILWFLALLHTVLGQAIFGTSYQGNPVLCREWSCLNFKLGFRDYLPDQNYFQAVLNSLLPERAWKKLVSKVVDTCYSHRPRSYTGTCPGQGLMLCAVDQLIQNCPEESLRKHDACTPVTSHAGYRHLFSQERYKVLEKNLRTDRRPEWFLKYYFSSKCCNLPDIFNATLLNECGFTDLITYYDLPPIPAYPMVNRLNLASTTVTTATKSKVIGSEYAGYQSIDPLDCCDMDEFIQPTWRSECEFHLNWSIPTRLVIKEVAKPSTLCQNVKVVPLSCEKETCVFKNLGVISELGSVDTDAFSKLLDNMTDLHPDWSKAKARAVTSCLARPICDYSEDCEINKVLACTMDVLSMNCPHAKKIDPCKDSNMSQDGVTCQINASNIGPKNRRIFCEIPNLVDHRVLSECEVNSISRMEYDVPVTESSGEYFWLRFEEKCQKSEPAKCVVNQMGALSKHRIMDSFKMRDRILNFTSQEGEGWADLSSIYVHALSAKPMYQGLCDTSKRLLNVLDFMLSTCPMSKRKRTHQCNKIFTEMDTIAPYTTTDKKEVAHVWRHFQQMHAG